MAKQKNDAAIARLEERYARQQAELDARHRTQMRDMYKGELRKAIEGNTDPSCLFPLIADAGFNPEYLLDQVISELESELRNKVKDQFCDIIAEALKKNPSHPYANILATFKAMDAEVDADLVKEAYDSVIAGFKNEYDAVLSEAVKLMLRDKEKGVTYIRERENISQLVAVLGKTVEACVTEAENEAKAEIKRQEEKIAKEKEEQERKRKEEEARKLREKREKTQKKLEGKVKRACVRRRSWLINGIVSIVLGIAGLIYIPKIYILSYIFIVYGILLILGSFWSRKRYEALKTELEQFNTKTKIDNN